MLSLVFFFFAPTGGAFGSHWPVPTVLWVGLLFRTDRSKATGAPRATSTQEQGPQEPRRKREFADTGPPFALPPSRRDVAT